MKVTIVKCPKDDPCDVHTEVSEDGILGSCCSFKISTLAPILPPITQEKVNAQIAMRSIRENLIAADRKYVSVGLRIFEIQEAIRTLYDVLESAPVLPLPPITQEKVNAPIAVEIARKRWYELLDSGGDQLDYATLEDACDEAYAAGAVHKTKASTPVPPEPAPEASKNEKLKVRARALFKPPFRFKGGYIWDDEGEMVADNRIDLDDDARAERIALRLRGWGRIGYKANGAELYDEIGRQLAEALTRGWDAAKAKP